MSAGQMPPWLQEQLMKMQQSQQNLQSIMTQKQHLDMEKAETEKALEELRKVADGDAVFKQAGTILIKSKKQELIDELEERIELTKTRSTVLQKQETRLKETLKEQEIKITEMMKGGSANSPPKVSPPADNPRK
ncbi:MAG: prefoldin subunit beta [Nitrosopumilus sp.]|nr:prefoldin subunit beta [Nitrosopumilus sp.]MDF2423374.1 prefoldin subunit beta [Nitrosopumilus sp.]MDF2425530.1 prefoldin subunit beta [Nitrosopumilus sp.]MDF2426750.1 prefoldin subunit beta [Nitrosopumilus sp.]MDF2427987.1 prefoldin subunit beta [Nitrosopumilus sp.]